MGPDDEVWTYQQQLLFMWELYRTMADRIGQHLGNYTLVRLLGRGGQAEVYLGEHRAHNSFAALAVVSACHVSAFRERNGTGELQELLLHVF